MRVRTFQPHTAQSQKQTFKTQSATFIKGNLFFQLFLKSTPVELPYISCKNLAEVVHFRHYLQESCKNLGFQTNLSDSCRSDISCRFRPFLQDSCRSRHFLQDSWTDLARQCLKLERYSARKCLECTGNNKAFFPILNQEYAQIECKCLVYVVART